MYVFGSINTYCIIVITGNRYDRINKHVTMMKNEEK